MADNTSHRRNLAAPHPQKPMDPTQRNPKPNPSTGKNHHHHNQLRHHPQPPIHPLPDPTITPPSTIQNISHRFSKLYANHKKLVSHSIKPGPHPQPDPHFRTTKDLSSTPVSDTSCTTLTKSSSQKSAVAKKIMEKTEKFEKNYYFATKTKAAHKDGFKKPSFEKTPEKNPSPEPPELILKCLENEDVRGFGGGGGVDMGKRRSSLSCIPPTVSGGRRRSFCNSQVELADFLSCSGVKVVAVDMPPFMQVHAVDCARKAHDSLEKFTSKTLAYTLKKEFDGEYGPAWHCIVGTSFGSFVTHSVGGFMYFSMDHKLYILLFKTTVQRAE
ncbi:hypothetical protein OROMI_003183 [Orobanche minor]